MKKGIKRWLSVIACTVLILSSAIGVPVMAAGSLAMDGDASDWSKIDSLPVNGGQQLSGWKAAYDDSNIYLMYTGTANNQWDYGWGQSNAFTISGNGKNETYFVFGNASGMTAKNSNWQDRKDVQVGFNNGANHNNAGPYVVEMAIPRAQFGDSYTISFAGASVSSSDLKNLAAAPETPETPETPAEPKTTYEGITIDGDFSDWGAVAKTATSDVNSGHPNTIVSAATVWDGDYFYVYVKEGAGQSITWAGTHNNGKFQIGSDLGVDPLVFQFKQNGVVEGIDGVSVKHVGAEWELAIPKDQLPNYSRSLNFGFFTNGNESITPIIDGIMNLDGSTNENKPTEKFVLDGNYNDWSQVPHSEVAYDTAGAGHNSVDANAVLMIDGDRLIGHAVTGVQDHTRQAGGEFASGTVVFAVNAADMNNPQPSLNWRLVTVDGSGRINWNPRQSNLSPGTYEFYISSVDAWGSAATLDDADIAHNPIYGKVIMTVGVGGKDEMEFYMDIDKVAQHLNQNAGDLKTFQNHYYQLGNKWVSAAGTSTGPVLGIIICLAVVGASFIYKRRRTDGRVGCVEA
ncbi:MAG: hypothetical protein IK152_07705 [Lachnospiraceae bacterium]|nr:hypothetical protein [Lachnospiraceae bacterium]